MDPARSDGVVAAPANQRRRIVTAYISRATLRFCFRSRCRFPSRCWRSISFIHRVLVITELKVASPIGVFPGFLSHLHSEKKDPC
ncbi:hypothetical protein VTN96DRAFT_9726 [Rasamsonia emersonii]